MASSFRHRAAQAQALAYSLLAVEELAGGWPGRAGWWPADRNGLRWG
jgi:hypothetical protein